jgi:hypothetical protein
VPDGDQQASLPSGALVLRGGGMNPPNVVKAAQKHERSHPGQYAISVRSRADYDESQLADRIVGPVYMLSTVARLRELGYEVEASEREPGDAHADLIFPSRPTEEEVSILKSAGFTRKVKQNG